MKHISRRHFLAGSAAIGAAVLWPGSRVLGANDDIRVGVVGVRGRGANHIDEIGRVAGARIAAICDVDRRVLDAHAAKLKSNGTPVETFTDIRKLLDSKAVDAVAIATPNHWHALATVWACQAGKDVYVEKPVSHEIWEGRKMIEAARKYGRIVQAGTQSRSDLGLADVFEYIRQGNIGKITLARALCYKRRDSIGKVSEPTPIPDYIDYDLWCGPAPKAPLMRKNLHYDWHWVWPTGNGDIGNQDIHEMDMCRWALGQQGLPRRVISIGGRLGYEDDGQTPNTQLTLLDYQPVPILSEVRGLPHKKGEDAMDAMYGVRIGIIIHCEGGYYAGGATGGWVYDKDGKRIKQFPQRGSGDHQANWLQAVRSRKVEDLHADIAVGHVSSSLCHMSNISYRVGKQAGVQQAMDAMKSNKDAVETVQRVLEHLKANEVDVEKTPLTVGMALEVDAQGERFTGPFAEQANRLLRREYRKPFEIPDRV